MYTYIHQRTYTLLCISQIGSFLRRWLRWCFLLRWVNLCYLMGENLFTIPTLLVQIKMDPGVSGHETGQFSEQLTNYMTSGTAQKESGWWPLLVQTTVEEGNDALIGKTWHSRPCWHAISTLILSIFKPIKIFIAQEYHNQWLLNDYSLNVIIKRNQSLYFVSQVPDFHVDNLSEHLRSCEYRQIQEELKFLYRLSTWVIP